MVRGISLRQLIGLVPAVVVFGTDDDIPLLVVLVGGIALLVLLAVLRVVAWWRHTYELRAGRIIERSGVVARSERALEVERIQQVDVDRTLLDRLVGTCELRLETAGDSGDSELTLRVVSVEEAARLRRLLARRVGADAGTRPAQRTERTPSDDAAGTGRTPAVDSHRAAPPEEVLVAVPLHHVALAAVTGPRLLAVPAAIAVVVSVIADNAMPEEIIDTAGAAVSRLSATAGVLLFLALVVGAVVLAAVTGVVRDGGFTIGLRGQDLLVRRGLTTTRSATVPLRRVQRVTVRRRWLQSALGFASITVHSAGSAGPGDGGATGALDRSLTVPLLPAGDVEALVTRLLAVDVLPPLRAHPARARRRAVARGALRTLGVAVPTAVAAVVFELPWLLAGAAVLLLLGAGGGLLRYRQLASGADARAVAGRTGALGSTTEISPLRKTQGTTVRSSVLQRRLGLASLSVHVAGPAGGITLQDLDADVAVRTAPTLLR